MSRFHFILRFLVLVGLLVAGAAAIVCAGELTTWDRAELEAVAHAQRGQFLMIALYALVGGTCLAALVLLIDLAVGVVSASGRRSVLGVNVIVQVALAVVLLVGVNAWSFLHAQRWDLTRGSEFTIEPEVASELRKLRGKTTIVVYQQHKAAGRLADRQPDVYDAAAERKVVEKVKDLVDQLREFGPQFSVVVLDAEEEDFDRKLAGQTGEFPALDAAIRSAPESSIFFCSGPNIQRMGFSEFYQLDKTASIQANGGRGNLIMLHQGIEPFARRVLAIEERKPRVGVAVIHELLTTHSTADNLTMAGLRKSLSANGYEVQDIILKRWNNEEPEPAPAAFTFEESRLEQVEADLAEINASLPAGRAERDSLQEAVRKLKEKSLEELEREYREQLRGRSMTEDIRQQTLNRYETILGAMNAELTQMEEDRRKAEKDLSELTRKEYVVEGRHISDLRAKTSRLLNDCDLLIIPRLTVIDLLNGWRISPRVYRLNDAQIGAIRDFVRAGKPVFVLFGPTNEGSTPALDAGEGDALESMFADLGIVFGAQTILYNAERQAFAERRVRPLGGGRAADIPPLNFELSAAQSLTEAAAPPNPLRQSLQLVARSSDRKIDLVLRHPRPIYFQSIRERPPYQAEFLITDPGTWNEEKPFPDRNYTPRFDPAKPNDPNRGTRDEERRGPFPVGVAVSTTVPPELADDRYRALKISALLLAGNPLGWAPGRLAAESLTPTDAYTRTDPDYKATPIRVAVIGDGGVFTSNDATRPDLPPAKEQLLLQTVNWLLGREDRLPHANKVWQYPRVELSPREQTWWRLGTFPGLPALFAGVGLLVLMARKTR